MAIRNGLQVRAQPDNGISILLSMQLHTASVNMVCRDRLYDEDGDAGAKVRCPA